MNNIRSFLFTPEQVKFVIKAYKKLTIAGVSEAVNAKYGLSITTAQIRSFTRNHGILSGRSGQFVKGQVSWNKGKPMPYNANSAKTQFKKGQLPHNTKQLGDERITKDGYIEISVDKKNKHTGFKRCYMLKHRHVWEQVNGEVPNDKCLKFLDGNRQNCVIENLEMIDRSTLPILSQRYRYDHAPKELKPSIMAVAKLENVINKKSA